MNNESLSANHVQAVEISEAELEAVCGGEMGQVSRAATNGHDGGDRQVAQAGSDYANNAY